MWRENIVPKLLIMREPTDARFRCAWRAGATLSAIVFITTQSLRKEKKKIVGDTSHTAPRRSTRKTNHKTLHKNTHHTHHISHYNQVGVHDECGYDALEVAN